MQNFIGYMIRERFFCWIKSLRSIYVLSEQEVVEDIDESQLVVRKISPMQKLTDSAGKMR